MQFSRNSSRTESSGARATDSRTQTSVNMPRKRRRSVNRVAPKRVASAARPVDWMTLPTDCVNWIILHVADMRDLNALRQCSRAWSAAVTHFAQIVRPRLRRPISPPDEWGFAQGGLSVLPNGRIDGPVWLEKTKPSRFGPVECVRWSAPFFNGLFHGRVTKRKQARTLSYARVDECTFVAGRPIDGRWRGMTFAGSFLIHTFFRTDYGSHGNGWERGRGTSVYFDMITDTRVSVERVDNGIVDIPDNAVFDRSWGHARDTYVVSCRRPRERTITTGPIVGLDTVHAVLHNVFMSPSGGS